MKKVPDKNTKSKYWWFILYLDSAPTNWIEVLRDDFLVPCCVSPLHDPDRAEGTLKPHHHIILEFQGPTTFNKVSDMTKELNATIPFPVPSLKGAYEYLTHANHPHKQQFPGQSPLCLNGFDYSVKYLEELSHDYSLQDKIIEYIKEYDFKGYMALIIFLMYNDYPAYIFASKRSLFFSKILDGSRCMSTSEKKKLNDILGFDYFEDLREESLKELNSLIHNIDNQHSSGV